MRISDWSSDVCSSDLFDDWHRGAVADVSPAWRIAIDSAERQAVTGTGSVFLGMNAHVNRDLPFVLAEIGLVNPDGTSRKPDHDRTEQRREGKEGVSKCRSRGSQVH